MPKGTPSTPTKHPFTDLYYYPGHSFSPLNYISLTPANFDGDDNDNEHRDDQDSTDGPEPTTFYALDDKHASLGLVIVLLEYEAGDERIKDMRRSLFPGIFGYEQRSSPRPSNLIYLVLPCPLLQCSIFELPSSTYKTKSSTHTITTSLSPSRADVTQPPDSPSILVPPTQSQEHIVIIRFRRLKFRYPGPKSNLKYNSHSNTGDNHEEEEDDDDNDDDEIGWWRKAQDWGKYVKDGKARRMFERAVLERIDEFVDTMEQDEDKGARNSDGD
ncbi:hypothetical protein CI109_107116 [Kwoniella shandongensis]|uniref:Uncharacterized protein n=1 Tax=Kwoniella shandongensis TaxID=1734106 RepID=A0A5M6C1Q4_9TREE|nr:uncharacterized protein CI109_002399 [Kwoniella shandongensis]KAA5529058.1 hypothetical protein CI109_002399 [Kwoniella shandongensis]